MNHETCWERLPDLLQERPDRELRAHLRSCHACQQQLFRLARVDALLRQQRWSRRPYRRARRRLLPLACAAAVVAASVAAVMLLSARHSSPTQFVLRGASGEIFGRGRIERADAENRLISLDARGLPRRLGDMYLLWATTGASRGRLVGRFMVDASGSCHVRFSLPASQQVDRLWVTPEQAPSATTAST